MSLKQLRLYMAILKTHTPEERIKQLTVANLSDSLKLAANLLTH